MTLLFLAAAVQGMAQTPSWYIGVQGGTSFGQGTFRSITEHQIHWGAQGGFFGGYQFNRLLSLETTVQYGSQTQEALDCCTYWLAEDGTRYMSPAMDQTGWDYHDINTRTAWGKLAFLANINVLALLTDSACKWSLGVGPQIAAVTTKTRLATPDKEIAYGRQWHAGWGGQASLGYQISERISASLYGGITCLSGERFDNIPVHAHKSNLIWDAGIKLAFRFGTKKKAQKPAVPAPAPVTVIPEAKETPATPIVREEAPVAEDTAAAEKEKAFGTPIPTVYFAHNSFRVQDEYVPALEQALSILERYPDFKLEIHAFSSKSGQRAYNRELSRLRMEEVQYWFVGRGISLERLEKVFYHGVDDKASNAAEARRAELRFVK